MTIEKCSRTHSCCGDRAGSVRKRVHQVELNREARCNQYKFGEVGKFRHTMWSSSLIGASDYVIYETDQNVSGRTKPENPGTDDRHNPVQLSLCRPAVPASSVSGSSFMMKGRLTIIRLGQRMNQRRGRECAFLVWIYPHFYLRAEMKYVRS